MPSSPILFDVALYNATWRPSLSRAPKQIEIHRGRGLVNKRNPCIVRLFSVECYVVHCLGVEIAIGIGIGNGLWASVWDRIVSRRRHLRQSRQCVECNSQRQPLFGSINYNVIYQSEWHIDAVVAVSENDPQPRTQHLLLLLLLILLGYADRNPA